MSKHHRAWNVSVYESYVREGRGRGSGSDYTPWIYVQDFASRGVVSRVKGRTTVRSVPQQSPSAGKLRAHGGYDYGKCPADTA